MCSIVTVGHWSCAVTSVNVVSPVEASSSPTLSFASSVTQTLISSVGVRIHYALMQRFNVPENRLI